jgi:hypothetical protein
MTQPPVRHCVDETKLAGYAFTVNSLLLLRMPILTGACAKNARNTPSSLQFTPFKNQTRICERRDDVLTETGDGMARMGSDMHEHLGAPRSAWRACRLIPLAGEGRRHVLAASRKQHDLARRQRKIP